MSSLFTAEMQEELKRPYLGDAERIVALTGGGYWPTLFKLKNNTLGAILRTGAPHVGNNGALSFIYSADGGKNWSTPLTVVPPLADLDVRGSASGVMADGTIVCGYVETNWCISGKFDISKYSFSPYFVYSTDNGKTWSAKRKLIAPPFIEPALYGRICVLPDNTALMALYGRIEGKGKQIYSGIIRSTDNGRNWDDVSIIAPGFNETTLLYLPDGRLLAFMRQEGRAVGVFQAESTDNGYTWTKPYPLTVAHQHPADAVLLNTGTLLLTYGNRIGELAVGAMCSYDLGKTWEWKRRFILAKDSLILKGKTWGDCGYPTTVPLTDGTIVTLYYRLGHTGLSLEDQERCLQYLSLIHI